MKNHLSGEENKVLGYLKKKIKLQFGHLDEFQCLIAKPQKNKDKSITQLMMMVKTNL